MPLWRFSIHLSSAYLLLHLNPSCPQCFDNEFSGHSAEGALVFFGEALKYFKELVIDPDSDGSIFSPTHNAIFVNFSACERNAYIDIFATMDTKQPEIRIEKWKHSRFWAIFVNGELLAVTVYKKGAEALRKLVLEGG